MRWILLGIGLAGALAAAPWLIANEPWTRPSHELVDALLREKKFDRAARLAARITTQDPKDSRAWFELARAHAGAGRLEPAVDALRNVPDWSLRKQDALLFEAKLLLELKRARAAETALRAIIQAGGSSTQAVSARLELFAVLAMEERAQAFKDLFWQTFPLLAAEDRLPALTMRTRLEFEQTKPELNAERLREYVRNDPSDQQARAGLATALDHANDLEGARKLYEEALAALPSDTSIRARLLDLLMRQGDVEAFDSVLAARQAGDENDADIQRFVGLAAQRKNDPEAAAAAFARAVELRPDVPENYHRLSQALLRLGKRELAAQAAQQRTRLNEARDTLRKAWGQFADVYESKPEAVTADLVEAVGKAFEDAGLPQESEAWLREAQIIRNSRNQRVSGDNTP